MKKTTHRQKVNKYYHENQENIVYCPLEQELNGNKFDTDKNSSDRLRSFKLSDDTSKIHKKVCMKWKVLMIDQSQLFYIQNIQLSAFKRNCANHMFLHIPNTESKIFPESLTQKINNCKHSIRLVFDQFKIFS